MKRKSLNLNSGKIKIFIVALLCSFNIIITRADETLPLIPQPNSLIITNGNGFLIRDLNSVAISHSDLEPSASALKNIMKQKFNREIENKEIDVASVILSLDSTLNREEHYKIFVESDGIKINGATPSAVFRGVSTLNQLLKVEDLNQSYIPALEIDDSPRFGYRAIMLDPARHFLPADDVKSFIELMAAYKFNKLQLHLSDDQGWRVKLESHPELSSEQSYSREELKDIIDFAKDHYIDIIPEIDIPGHTSAFLSVYPNLGCDHLIDNPITVGETDNRMLCAAKPEVYSIFQDIFKELSEIFPYEYIHIGGDEAAIPKNWAKCESCLELMETEGFKTPAELMNIFFGKMLGYVRENGKKPILWCELNNIYPPADDYLFPYPEDVTLVTWRMGLTPTCIEITEKNNHPLIMAPGEYAYLDYPQLKGDLPEFRNWGMPVTTLSKSYQFDPGYGLTAEENSHILGVMATLWGEAIQDINRVTYMAFPRALAIAEAGWTQMNNRDWDSFKKRLYPNLYDLMLKGVSFRVPFEIVSR